jgi:hypothetical protein
MVGFYCILLAELREGLLEDSGMGEVDVLIAVVVYRALVDDASTLVFVVLEVVARAFLHPSLDCILELKRAQS